MKSGLLKSCSICALSLTLLNSVLFGASAGTSGGQFLKIDIDARTASLGGASACAGGSAALFHNPAGLNRVENMDAVVSQISWLKDIRYASAGFAKRIGESVYGIGINYLTVPSIDKYNNLGEKLNTSYAPSDKALTLSYARSITEDFSAGVSGKYISSSLEEETATAMALDLGALYTAIPNVLDLGAAVQNLGTSMTYRNTGDPLPLNLKAGGRYAFFKSGSFDARQQAFLSTDLNMMNDTGFFANFGVELDTAYNRDFTYALRAGYRTNTNEVFNGLSYGLGIAYKKMYAVDYAYSSYGDIGQAHRVSLSVRFGEPL